MKRHKPTAPGPLTSDPRFTLRGRGFNVQQLPPTQPNPRKKIGHPVKVRPSSVGGTVVPIRRRTPILRVFFGIGGGVKYRK